MVTQGHVIFTVCVCGWGYPSCRVYLDIRSCILSLTDMAYLVKQDGKGHHKHYHVHITFVLNW